MPQSSLSEEIRLLIDKKFLLSSDRLEDIRNNSYAYQIWADVFWRRRFRHATREDPELKYVFQSNPSQVLEIGTGYGRILRKLLEWENQETEKIKFTGIEMCAFFQPYFQQYRSQFPSLQSAEFIWDNFLTTSSLEVNSFDIILLPMNTLANLSIESYERLFKIVRNYLADDGMFLFSNYHIPDSERLDKLIGQKYGYAGDLLLELGSGLITAEYYDLPSILTEYGAYSPTYIIYSTFSSNYTLQKRELFRSLTTFVLPTYLKSIITACGFDLKILDDSSHSSVFGLTKG